MKTLSEVNLFNLDPIEYGMFERFNQYMPKEKALEVIINSVEGDLWQLSSELLQTQV